MRKIIKRLKAYDKIRQYNNGLITILYFGTGNQERDDMSHAVLYWCFEHELYKACR